MEAGLQDDKFKDIILESLRFLVMKQRVAVYAFVILNNHFHLIWQMMVITNGMKFSATFYVLRVSRF
jgi:hypothetical protein